MIQQSNPFNDRSRNRIHFTGFFVFTQIEFFFWFSGCAVFFRTSKFILVESSSDVLSQALHNESCLEDLRLIVERNEKLRTRFMERGTIVQVKRETNREKYSRHSISYNYQSWTWFFRNKMYIYMFFLSSSARVASARGKWSRASDLQYSSVLSSWCRPHSPSAGFHCSSSRRTSTHEDWPTGTIQPFLHDSQIKKIH